jgi:Macrocin-O-methyltransferase (TylF)
MLSLKRLDNIQLCVETVIRENISGDLIETGVMRGGAAIVMRAILRAYGAHDRTVWVADSFEGFPH